MTCTPSHPNPPPSPPSPRRHGLHRLWSAKCANTVGAPASNDRYYDPVPSSFSSFSSSPDSAPGYAAAKPTAVARAASAATGVVFSVRMSLFCGR